MDFTLSELMAVAGARELKDGEVVLVGVGLPQIAACLAKRTHAPSLHILLETGVMDAEPVELGVGIADPRLWYGASRMGGYAEVLGMILQRGLVDVGFLGALEVDIYGNLNSTLVKTPQGIRHFTGSGGANDIASLAKRVLIIMRHDARKFPPLVQYLTSPGFLSGGAARRAVGLRGGGPYRVITDKAVLGFDNETKRMKLLSLHPGIAKEEVINSTGFDLIIEEPSTFTPLPTAEELKLIRTELDPQRIYT